MPSLAIPLKSPRSYLLPELDALILAARRLPVSENPLVGCPASCCPRGKRVKDNDTKSICGHVLFGGQTRC